MANTPLALFLQHERENPTKIFLRQPFQGQWKSWTYAQAGEESRRIAQGLMTLGLSSGDHVAIISKNCAHWIMADLAIMMAGMVSIPIYPSLGASAIRPILEHSESKAVFMSKLDDFPGQQDGVPTGVTIIGAEVYGHHGHYSWEQLVRENPPLSSVFTWKPTDLMTIIYTSGTTGNAKGVMHNAGTTVAVIKQATIDLDLPANPSLFSYLPLSHIAERIGIEMNALLNNGSLSFAESLDTFAHNLAEVQPSIFFGVPRIWAKFQEGILKKMDQKKLDLLLSIPLISSIIKKSIKKKLGLANSSYNISGAAPIATSLVQWFAKLGITIYQGYAMTEDCICSHFESKKAHRLGSVGKPLQGVKRKITEHGELCVHSVGLMQGYYKEPALTAAMFDQDGYLKTGDIGEYDHDGFLFITGRVKDQFKTDKGKYISPTPIEMKLMANKDIEHVCVVGMGIPQPIALITLSDAGKKKSTSEISQSLANTLHQVNPSLEVFEKLAKAVIMKESWTLENGLLTPTLKIKRNQVEKIHHDAYPHWFNQSGEVIWE